MPMASFYFTGKKGSPSSIPPTCHLKYTDSVQKIKRRRGKQHLHYLLTNFYCRVEDTPAFPFTPSVPQRAFAYNQDLPNLLESPSFSSLAPLFQNIYVFQFEVWHSLHESNEHCFLMQVKQKHPLCTRKSLKNNNN